MNSGWMPQGSDFAQTSAPTFLRCLPQYLSTGTGLLCKAMPAKKAPVARREEQIKPLTEVITSLDSMRAYRRRSGQNLEEMFSRLGGMGYPELRKIWWDIDEDVRDIMEMPLKVPRVPLLIHLNLYLKIIGRVFLIVLVLILAGRLVRIWEPVLGELFGDRLWLLILVAVGGLVAINGEVVVDYIIRRRIVRYEEESKQEYAEHVENLKQAAQKVISQLVREVRHARKDPGEYPFFLFFDDYEGIEVTKVKTPRSMGIFKRKFSVFTAIPKIS